MRTLVFVSGIIPIKRQISHQLSPSVEMLNLTGAQQLSSSPGRLAGEALQSVDAVPKGWSVKWG